MKIFKWVYITILLQFNFLTFGQNLVPNPDFELYSSCPPSYSTLSLAIGWVQPTQGTSDFLDTCATPFSNADVPLNWFGSQTPYNGGGYAGLYAFYIFNYSYREYIQAQLSSPLVVNKKYYISCRVSLADSSKYATDDLGIYISQNSVGAVHDSALLFIPQVANPQNQFINNKTSWKRIFGSYTAIGGEDHITIGNFKNDLNTDTILAPLPHKLIYYEKASYYYIDHVCVSLDSAFCYNPNDEVGITELTSRKSSIYYSNEKIIIDQNGNYTIELFDMYGVKWKNEVLEGKQSLDVSNLERGCYLVTLHHNGSIVRKKLYVSN